MNRARRAASVVAAAGTALLAAPPALAAGSPALALGPQQTVIGVESAVRGPRGLRLVLTLENRGNAGFPVSRVSPVGGPQGFAGVAVVDPVTGRWATAFRPAECRCSDLPSALKAGEALTFEVDVADPGGARVDVVFAGFLPVTGVEVDGDAAPAEDPEVTELLPRTQQPAPRTAAGAVSSNGEALALDTDVLFAFGSAQLSAAAGGDLDRVAVLLRAQPTRRVAVQGHTDGQGDEAFNLRLSQQRATTVRDALATRLGDGWTFDVQGFGETRPVASETTDSGAPYPEGQALNRRVGLRVDGD